MKPLIALFCALVGAVLWALTAGGLYLANLSPWLPGIHKWLFNTTFLYWYSGIWVTISVVVMVMEARDSRNYPGSYSRHAFDDDDPSVGDPRGPDGESYF